MRREAEAELRCDVNQCGVHSAQGFGPELVPELMVVAQMPGVEADSARLRWALEPGRANQRAVFRGQGLEVRELRRGADLRDVFPVFQLRPGFAADTGDQALVSVPSGRERRIREPFGLRQRDRAVEDFGPAVSPAEDLLVDFPSRLADMGPPFPELGALQIVVHVVFLPRRCVSRSVTCFSTGTEPLSPAQHGIARQCVTRPCQGQCLAIRGFGTRATARGLSSRSSRLCAVSPSRAGGIP